MKIAMLIEMPSDTLLQDLSEAIQIEAQQFSYLSPQATAPGSADVLTNKVLYCVVDAEDEDPLTLIKDRLTAHSLTWTILGMQSLYPIEPITSVIEEEEVVVGHQAKKFMNLDLSIWDYIPDRLDADEQPLTKDPGWITHYSGVAPWR